MLLAVIYGLFLTVQLSASQLETPGSDNSSCQTDGAPRSFQVQQQINYGSDDMEPIAPSSSALWIQCTEDWYNGSQQCQCECGDSLGDLVECDNKSLDVHLAVCYCMSHYQEDQNTIVVGACAYQCYHHEGNSAYYHISDYECNRTARTDQLCGRCQTGYAPPVYSYDLQCVECSSGHNAIVKRWVKYIVIAFLPLTIFFIIVITLNISVASPSLNAFILVSQLLTAPVLSRMYVPVLKNDIQPHSMGYFPIFVLSLYGIWNLDFFRTFYDPFCLHPSMTILQVFALDYIIAAYPLFLITITYVLVKLHNHKYFKLVLWLWKPFRRCFIRFRRYCNIKTSLLESDAFTAFCLLSYVKFFSVSFDLLIPVNLQNVHGHTINQTYVYYNGTMVYFGEQHLPYAILAITVIILFTILPILLLCLYPCRCFQNCCKQRCTVLPAFINTFQGCYKERTGDRYDRRWFSAVYLVTRIAVYTITAITHEVLLLTVYLIFLLILTAILTEVVGPYNSCKHNSVDVVLILILAVIPLMIASIFSSRSTSYTSQIIIMLVFAVLPLVYLIVILFHWIVIGKQVRTAEDVAEHGQYTMLQRVWMLLPCTIALRQRGLDEQLPDRLANPEGCAVNFCNKVS